MSEINDRLNATNYFYFKLINLQKQDEFNLFRWNLEAFIVFARSITSLIQKKYNKLNNFEEWYTEKQEEMKKNEVFLFFKKKRDFIIHQKSIDGKEIKKEIKIIGYSPHIPGIKPRLKVTKESDKLKAKVCNPNTGQEIDDSFSMINYMYSFKKYPKKQVKDIASEYLQYLEALTEEAKNKFERITS